MDHLSCAVLNEKALLQMNKVLPKGSLQRPSLPLAWCHDQFNTRTACPPLLTPSLMAFPAQGSIKLHFIAVVFLLFDSFLYHLCSKVPIYLSIYLSFTLVFACFCHKFDHLVSHHLVAQSQIFKSQNFTTTTTTCCADLWGQSGNMS